MFESNINLTNMALKYFRGITIGLGIHGEYDTWTFES